MHVCLYLTVNLVLLVTWWWFSDVIRYPWFSFCMLGLGIPLGCHICWVFCGSLKWVAIHLVTFVLGNSIIVGVWYLWFFGYPWFLYPLCIWAVLLILLGIVGSTYHQKTPPEIDRTLTPPSNYSSSSYTSSSRSSHQEAADDPNNPHSISISSSSIIRTRDQTIIPVVDPTSLTLGIGPHTQPVISKPNQSSYHVLPASTPQYSSFPTLPDLQRPSKKELDKKVDTHHSVPTYHSPRKGYVPNPDPRHQTAHF